MEVIPSIIVMHTMTSQWKILILFYRDYHDSIADREGNTRYANTMLGNLMQYCIYIKSFATGHNFNIQNRINCTTLNVIYVVFCMKCGKQGVGSIIKWKSRLANYKSHIKKKIRSCVIVNHLGVVSTTSGRPNDFFVFGCLEESSL